MASRFHRGIGREIVETPNWGACVVCYVGARRADMTVLCVDDSRKNVSGGRMYAHVQCSDSSRGNMLRALAAQANTRTQFIEQLNDQLKAGQITVLEYMDKVREFDETISGF